MEKKQLLSDGNDNFALDFNEILAFLSTKKNYKGALTNDSRTAYLMGISSPLLNIPVFGLYDQEDLVKKYPNGIVTESMVLIPLEQFKKVKLDSIIENNINNKYKYKYERYGIGNFALYLHQYMLNFLEVALNIDLNKDDKFKLISNVQNIIAKELKFVCKIEMIQTYKGNQFIKLVEEPEKTTNRELLKLMEGKGYAIEDRLKNPLNVEQDVKEILKINDSYIKGVEVLENKIKEVSFKEIKENITIEAFQELIDNANTGAITQITPLKIVNKKIDKLSKECGLNINDFINKAQTELFPFMVSLNPLQFKLSMENIMKKVFEPHTNSKFFDSGYQDYLNMKKDFGLELSKNTDEDQRAYLIDVLSGFDVLNNNHLRLTSNKKKLNK